jgi:hypothetical protein
MAYQPQCKIFIDKDGNTCFACRPFWATDDAEDPVKVKEYLEWLDAGEAEAEAEAEEEP